MQVVDRLRLRARVEAEVREYFRAADVLEVTTPLLGEYGSTDPTLANLVASAFEHDSLPERFLQTSPEFAMKRLLAAGSGDIFQICPAFRAEEAGPHHRPEFTIVEWYRCGFDHHQLMDDVETLVQRFIKNVVFRRVPYATLFRQRYACDPMSADTVELARLARSVGFELGAGADHRVILLDALMSEMFRDASESNTALFVYDFPPEQAAYARLSAGEPPVAERFELLVGGIELANGYHEITEADEQLARHVAENNHRAQRGLTSVPTDTQFLAALANGLPNCAGVALGLDRLLMLAAGVADLSQIEAVPSAPAN